MAEVVASLALACNVIQVLDHGLKVVLAAKQVYTDGQIDSNLSNQALQLGILAGKLENNLKSATTGQAGSVAPKELHEAARECCSTAAKLQKELDKLKPKPGRSGASKAFDVSRIVVKALWKKSKLGELEKSMLKWQGVMDSGFLLRICSAQEAQSIQHGANFNKLDSALQLLVQQLAAGTKEISDKVEHEAGAIKDHIDQHIVSAQEKDRHEKLLNSLRFDDMNARKNIIADTFPTTFSWVFSAELPAMLSSQTGSLVTWSSFSKWLKRDDAPHDPYWVSGKPGSGKSTLMRFLVEDHRTTDHLKPGTLILSHYFWAAGTHYQYSLEGLLRALTYQILTAEPVMVESLLKKLGSAGDKTSCSDWSQAELRDALLHCLMHSGRLICIFIDGLDESNGSNGPGEVMDLADELCRLQNIKVCVSSRPERPFVSRYEARPMLRVQDLTRDDIEKVCTKKLEALQERLPGVQYHKETLSSLVWMLTEKADGVFLWVILALRSVERGISNADSWQDILERLKTLPSDLEKLYKSMWERLGADRKLYESRGILILLLLLAGEPNPTIFELAVAHDPVLLDSIFDGFPLEEPGQWTLNTEALQEVCRDLSKRVGLYCGELVEVGAPHQPWGSSWSPGDFEAIKGLHPEILSAMRNTSVEFIHRTARDFLIASETGMSILAANPTPRSIHVMDRRLASLLQAMLREGRSSLYTMMGVQLGIVVSELSQVSVHDVDGTHQRRVLSISEKFCDYCLGLLKSNFPEWPLPDTLGVLVQLGFPVHGLQTMLGHLISDERVLSSRYLGYVLGQTLCQRDFFLGRRATPQHQELVERLMARGADPTVMLYMNGNYSMLSARGPRERFTGLPIRVVSPLTIMLQAALFHRPWDRSQEFPRDWDDIVVPPRDWSQSSAVVFQTIYAVLVSEPVNSDSVAKALSDQVLVVGLGLNKHGELLWNLDLGFFHRSDIQFVVELNAAFLLCWCLNLAPQPHRSGIVEDSLKSLEQVSSDSRPAARLLMIWTSISKSTSPEPTSSNPAGQEGFRNFEEPLPLDTDALLGFLTLDGPPNSILAQREEFLESLDVMVSENKTASFPVRDNIHFCEVLKAYCFPHWPPPKRHRFAYPPPVYADDEVVACEDIDAGYDSEEYYSRFREEQEQLRPRKQLPRPELSLIDDGNDQSGSDDSEE